MLHIIYLQIKFVDVLKFLSTCFLYGPINAYQTLHCCCHILHVLKVSSSATGMLL